MVTSCDRRAYYFFSLVRFFFNPHSTHGRWLFADIRAHMLLFTVSCEGWRHSRGRISDHRSLFHICFLRPVLSFNPTPTRFGLRSCSGWLVRQMNNSFLLSRVESDYSRRSVSAFSFFFSTSPPFLAPGVSLSPIAPSKTQRLSSPDKEKKRPDHQQQQLCLL